MSANPQPPADLVERFPFPDGSRDVPLGVDLLETADVMVAAAWYAAEKWWEEPATPQPETDGALWRWLWGGIHFDPAELAAVSGLDEAGAQERLAALAARRLVRPDGAVSPWFGHLTAGGVRERIGQPGKPRPAKEKVAE